jgi:hypothetical protein
MKIKKDGQERKCSEGVFMLLVNREWFESVRFINFW